MSRENSAAVGEHGAADILDVLERQRAALEQAQGALQALARGLADLDSWRDAAPRQAAVQILAEENDLLRKRLSALENSAPGTISAQELEQLRAENDSLRRLLDEATAPGAPPSAPLPLGKDELATYEAELNEFRRQLEEERRKLHAELQQLRVRNEELSDATRDLEMELSRERAELARERTRLERLREEIQADIERLQRDGGMRDSLAPLQRLREEINTRRSR